jgi:secretion/DNA translocation related TadE-like protein
VISRRRAGQQGSASIWVLACCALLMVLTAVAVVRALAVLARHQAESSADLVALAAADQIGVAADPCRAAELIAVRNGTRLWACRVRLAVDGRSGTVAVTVARTVWLPLIGTRTVLATARAARLPATLQPAQRLRWTAADRPCCGSARRPRAPPPAESPPRRSAARVAC